MIVPLIDVPAGALSGSDSESAVVAELQSTIARQSVAGEVYIHLNSADFEAGLPLLARTLVTSPCIVGPFAPADGEIAGKWLNAGAVRVVIASEDVDGQSFADCIDCASTFPASRVAVSLPHFPITPGALASVQAQLKPVSTGLVINIAMGYDDTDPQVWSIGAKSLVERRDKGEETWTALVMHERIEDDVELRAPAIESLVGELHRLGGDYPVHVSTPCVIPSHLPPAEAAAATVATEADRRPSIGRCVCACVRTDRPDGLYVTVVTDDCGVAIGLVYSNDQSICESIASGRGVYWSRSRKSIWRKGDTSGSWQSLLSVRMDCDNDALKFTVLQHGDPPGFCHRGGMSCWGADKGMGHLTRTLQSRLKDPPAGSYTQRLFNDRALLRNKLLEEAQELSEALDEEDGGWHVAEETADLLYFAMVAAVAGGVSMRDVELQLDNRALKVKRRPGNAKAHRIAAAEAALGAKAPPSSSS